MSSWSPRLSWQSVMTAPTYSCGTWMVSFTKGSSMRSMSTMGGSFGRVVDDDHSVVEMLGPIDVIDDARRGRDEVEVELAVEALLDDLHVEQPRKPQR